MAAATTARYSQRLFSAPTLLGASAVGVGLSYYGYSRYQAAARSPYGSKKSNIFSIASADAAKKSPFGFGFTAITLSEAHMVNHNVKYLKFKLPDGYEDSGMSPITSMLTNHTPEGAWIPVIRPYTPVDKGKGLHLMKESATVRLTFSDEPGHISFMVKKYPDGKGSGHMHSLKPGDELKVKPLHEFDYKPNQYSNLTILAGGAGITPFIQLIRAVLRNPSDTTKINLVYANNTEEDIILRSELDRLSRERPEQFKASYVVTKPGPNGDGRYQTGHITRQIIEQALPARSDWPKSKVLVCGPDPMIEAIAGKKGFGFAQGSLGGMLKDLGLEKAQVQKF